jgi:uncharacterized membrane protein
MNEEILRSIQELLQSPQQFHAAVVHLPIAAGIFGLLTLLGLIFASGNNDGLRWVTVVIFLVGAGSGFLAQKTGHDAMLNLNPVGHEISDQASEDLSNHEEMGEKVWIAMGVTAFLVALSAVERPKLRATFLGLATIAAIATVIGVAITGHLGGQLVYRHGAGVPDSPNNNAAAQPTTAPATTQPDKPQ